MAFKAAFIRILSFRRDVSELDAHFESGNNVIGMSAIEQWVINKMHSTG